MKKNGPLLRDSITEKEKAAAHRPLFLPPFLFSSRCQSLGMLNIRAGMVLKQTQHTGIYFLSAIRLEIDKRKHERETGHYALHKGIHMSLLIMLD